MRAADRLDKGKGPRPGPGWDDPLPFAPPISQARALGGVLGHSARGQVNWQSGLVSGLPGLAVVTTGSESAYWTTAFSRASLSTR